MKRPYLLTLIFSITMMFFLAATPAHAEDMMDNLLPQDTSKKQEGNVQLDYNKYPLSRYGMDTQLGDPEFTDMMPWGWESGVGKQINQGMATVNSSIWGLNKILAASVGTLVSESFNFDIINRFSSSISQAIKSIAGFGPGGLSSNGLWPYMITSIVCIIGIWAAYIGIVKRATSQALGGILKSLIIMAISLGFFMNSEKILNGVNSGVSEVQNDVLSFALSATTPGQYNEQEGIASMRNQIFNLMVTYPYLLLEYGTTDKDQIESEWKQSGSRLDAMLKTPFYSTERQDAIKYEVEEMKNSNMKPEALTDRFIILILVLIMNCIMGVILILLSSSLIFYQVLALVFSIFSPIALLIGLIPTFSATANNLLMRLAHAFYMKIALALLMTVYFTIAAMVYNSMNPNSGYLLLFMIQIICTVAVYVKRNEIMNVITVPFRKANVNNLLGQSIKEYKQTYFKGKKYFNKAAAPFINPVAPLAERTGWNKVKYNPGIGVVNPLQTNRYGPSKNTAPAATQAQTSGKVKGSGSAPAAPVMKAAQTAQTAPAAPAPAPVERTQPVAPIKSTAPQVNVPPIQSRPNMDSLEKTLDKGGSAHHTKEDIQLKGHQGLKDRLVHKQAAAQQDIKPPLYDRPVQRKPEMNDRVELQDRSEK